MILLFPALGWIRSKFPALIPLADGDRFRGKTFEFFRKAIQEHKETITEGQPRDFIDAYLEEVKKTQDPSSSFYENSKDGGTWSWNPLILRGQVLNSIEFNFTDLNFIITLLDLFVAGSETTSTTLMWSFFLLAQHPQSQEKVAQEIKARVGSREVLLEDRPQYSII